MFVCKFLKIWISSNIFSEPYFIVCLSMFIEQCESRSISCIKSTSSVEIYLEDSMSELYFKYFQIFKCLNESDLQYYLFLYLCHFQSTNIFGFSLDNMWHPNLLGLFFVTLCGIKMYLDNCFYLLQDIFSSLNSFSTDIICIKILIQTFSVETNSIGFFEHLPAYIKYGKISAPLWIIPHMRSFEEDLTRWT